MLSFLPSNRFPLPDWAAFHQEPEDPDASAAKLEAAGKEWMRQLIPALGKDYLWYQSPRFWLVSGAPAEESRRLLAWADHCYVELERFLGEVMTPPQARIPILLMRDLETYYDYVCEYLPEGDHGLSGGMFINHGYGHFILSFLDIAQAYRVIAHELAHALVQAHRIPAWLNEGIAQLSEMKILGSIPMDEERLLLRMDHFWNEDSIQGFWNGSSFNRQDEGQEQSYYLSLRMTQQLVRDLPRFRAFVLDVSSSDHGDAALRQHFNLSLSELASTVLGDGKWHLVLP